MARKNIRITVTQVAQEDLLKRENTQALEEWLELSIEDLSYRMRYASKEETQLYQGALRALDDLKDILSL